MVRHKRARGGTARYALQYRGLNLHVPVFIEIIAHGVVHARSFYEYFLDAIIDNKVYITATVAQLRIVKTVVGLAVFHLDYG